MPLRLFVGRANAGKTGPLHEIVVDAANIGVPATLILPSGRDVARVRTEFARRAPLGVRVASFNTWQSSLWAEVGDGRELVDHLIRGAVMASAIGAADLTAIRGSALTSGFTEVMGLVAARLCNSTTTTAGTSPEIREVSQVLVSYERELERLGLIEPARAAASMAANGFTPEGPLVFNRFSDLSEAQELLLVAAAASGDVSLGLTWERGFPATEALTPLVDRLVDAGAELIECESPAPASELERVAARLYAAPEDDVIVPTGAVELATAAGDEAEVEVVARTAARLIADGVPAERIAVVFRRPAGRPARLANALAEHGIRLDSDVVSTVGESGFGRALGGLLSSAGGTGSRATLLAFLHSPYSGARPDDVASLDRTWRRSRMTDLGALMDSASRLSGVTASTIRAASAVMSQPADRRSFSIWQNLADSMLNAALASRGSSAGTGRGDDLLDMAVHRTVLDAVAEATNLEGALAGSALAGVLPDLAVRGRPAERRGAVQLLDAAKARSRRFDAVIVGGLTAGEFSAERPEPLHARLERALGGRGGTEERLSERMLFYTLVTRARSKLVLVRQSSDSSGEPARPSVFWEDVVDLYLPPSATGEQPETPPGVPHERLMLSQLADAVPAFSATRRALRRTVEAGDATLERRLSESLDPSALEALAVQDRFSVTELEAYVTCPYQWFIARAVRPREIDALLDAREMGTRAHEMLARFYRVIPERLGIARVEPGSVDACLALFDEIAREVEAERRSAGGMTLAEELDMATARDRARSLVEQDATFLPGYEPIATEWGFSASMDVDDGTVTLRGKVDRIDDGPAGVVVTDYKLSRIHGLGAWDGRGILQVPLYASIAATQFERPVAGGVYRSLASLEARGFWRADAGVPLGEGHSYDDATTEDGVHEAIEQAWGTAADAVRGIRAGAIEPEPSRKDSCAYCLATPFCPKAVRT